ncbi:MAG: hypothetical protein VKP70_05770 [Cyanobacteriota bacterium]|nr:hypothetical protein [Cyanobacteriota bacterium]
MPHLIALAGALLNRCPPTGARFALRPVVEAACKQLNRRRLEGL